jgi:hypothetical protein
MNTTTFPIVIRDILAKGGRSLTLVITLGIAASLSALAFGFWFPHSRQEKDSVTTTLNASAAAPSMANASQEPKAEVVLLVLTPKGFDQDMITRPTGKFLLVVESRLGLKEPSLTLSRIVGNKSREDGNNSKEILKGGNIKKEQRNWSEELNLNPGEYELTEVNNPNWSCKLVITPN